MCPSVSLEKIGREVKSGLDRSMRDEQATMELVEEVREDDGMRIGDESTSCTQLIFAALT